MLLDKANNIWAATEKGIVFFEKGDKKYQKHIAINIAAKIINSTNNLNTIYKDSQGNLWIGTRLNGLLKGTVIGDTFIAEKVYNTGNNLLEDNFIGCITEDKEHQIWVGTRSSGLSIIDTKTDKITHLAHNNNDRSE